MNGNRWRFRFAVCLTAAFLLSAANAQETSKPEQAATAAAAPKVVNIWPGAAPGSARWKQKETKLHMGPMESIVNVTTPTVSHTFWNGSLILNRQRAANTEQKRRSNEHAFKTLPRRLCDERTVVLIGNPSKPRKKGCTDRPKCDSPTHQVCIQQFQRIPR